jgi:hypothetical protein
LKSVSTWCPGKGGEISSEIIRPIDEETAKAIQAGGKAISDVAGLAEKGGSWVSKVLGHLPGDVIGYYFGDGLHHKRLRRLVELEAETKAHHERWGCKGPKEDLSPSLGIPLLEAASDETREHLRELWSKLVAAAMHPERSKFVRASIVAAVKQMDPFDVLILEAIYSNGNAQWTPSGRDFLASRFQRSTDEVLVSFDNLERLGFIWFGSGPKINPIMMPPAKLLVQAVRG